ncbi:MAG: DUF4307 domain-containing protein [Actinomycetota bacterium]|nr:DUF4307 domain-containing protein [Actinomycetota bacterium]
MSGPAGASVPAPPAGRYGHGPRGSRRLRGVLAVLLLAALTAYVVWVGLHHASPPVRAGVLAYDVVGDDRVDVRLEVVREPGTPVSCRVRARDRAGHTVGTVDATVPPAGPQHQVVTVPVPTRARAVIGELLRCRPAPDSNRSG